MVNVTKVLKKLLSIVPRFSIDNSANEGSYVTVGELLICFGYATIQPSASLTAAARTITFKKAFKEAPIALTGFAGGPQVNVAIASVTARTTTTITLQIYMSNTTNRSLCWIAIGRAAD